MEPRACVPLLLLLLSAALCTADVPADCCLTVVDRRLPPKVIEKYNLQEEGRGCAIRATAFLVKGRWLCLPHPEQRPWVQRLIEKVDQRSPPL